MGQPCNCDVAKSARVSALSQDGTEVIVTGLQQAFRDDSRHFVGFCEQVMTSQSSLRTRNGLGRKPSRPVASGDL